MTSIGSGLLAVGRSAVAVQHGGLLVAAQDVVMLVESVDDGCTMAELLAISQSSTEAALAEIVRKSMKSSTEGGAPRSREDIGSQSLSVTKLASRAQIHGAANFSVSTVSERPNQEGPTTSAGASQTDLPSSEAGAVRTDEAKDAAANMVQHDGIRTMDTRSLLRHDATFDATFLETSPSKDGYISPPCPAPSTPEVREGCTRRPPDPEHAERLPSQKGDLSIFRRSSWTLFLQRFIRSRWVRCIGALARGHVSEVAALAKFQGITRTPILERIAASATYEVTKKEFWATQRNITGLR